MITFFGPLWLSFIYALTAYYWWYKSILSHTHLWWAYLHEIGIILEITTNIRKFWWFWFIPLGMTNIENAHCPSICCVGKRMQKEFSLWPWELSHKSRALEHVERGHSWIIKSINVHTAVTPDTIPVLKDLSKTFKHIWDSGRAPESCKDFFFFFFSGTLKVGLCLFTVIYFSDKSDVHYYLPSVVVRQLTTAQRTPSHVQTP